ncbi:hypothetical protein ACFOLJ_12560 [Rugamonas sp. CCM 8940]|uniref:hypothetical protein n=1 Tax=Rugamonas sp. CCM 8940 TaxID=2765359 RepID=UPI00360A7D5F
MDWAAVAGWSSGAGSGKMRPYYQQRKGRDSHAQTIHRITCRRRPNLVAVVFAVERRQCARRQFFALEAEWQTRIKLACGGLLLLVNGVLAVVVIRRKLRAKRG